MTSLWKLFSTFFKIGAITFGGGYAMLPIIQREIVDKHKWASNEEVLDYYAVGQCTPGVIAVNVATFTGYKERGIVGGIAATLGVICPSVIIISIIAAFLNAFAHLAIVRYAFSGIRVAVAVLIINAIKNLWKTGIKDAAGLIAFLVTFAIMIFTNISVVYLIIAAILFGIVYKKIKGGKN